MRRLSARGELSMPDAARTDRHTVAIGVVGDSRLGFVARIAIDRRSCPNSFRWSPTVVSGRTIDVEGACTADPDGAAEPCEACPCDESRSPIVHVENGFAKGSAASTINANAVTRDGITAAG